MRLILKPGAATRLVMNPLASTRLILKPLIGKGFGVGIIDAVQLYTPGATAAQLAGGRVEAIQLFTPGADAVKEGN